MPSSTPRIARIRLARSPVRLLALPALLLLLAAGLAATAILGPLRMGEAAWYVLVAGAGVLGLIGVAIGVRMASVRLDVEEAAVRVHWLGGERRYPLAPGPVTRVRLRGEQASRLRSRSRWPGVRPGRARLRDEEDIEVVRLAPTPTIILVPTERGRLAIAPASEDALIDALSRAARARQRLEEAADEAADAPTEPASEGVDGAAPAEPEPSPEPEPHVLTGIERALLEERLARERDEAEAAAAALPAASDAEDSAATVQPHEVDGEAATGARDAEAMPAAEGTAEPESRRARWRRGRAVVPRIGRPRPSAAFVLLPIVGAGIVWGAATSFDRLPDPASDLGRLTSLALVLAGPATSVGAIMARAWWPRLVGVVVTSGLAASVFVGRALLGA
jgi:hypothetical protein